jgi:hypothetical protein
MPFVWSGAQEPIFEKRQRARDQRGWTSFISNGWALLLPATGPLLYRVRSIGMT